MAGFQEALDFVLGWEGGYTNDPVDPGGATNFGIIQSEYDEYRKSKGLAHQSVRYISVPEYRDIYFNQYWSAMRCQYLPWPLTLALFDTAVNLGVGRACQYLAVALGIEDPPLKWTPLISSLVHKADPKDLCKSICDQRDAKRLARVAEKKSQKKFLKGWQNRDNALRRACGAS